MNHLATRFITGKVNFRKQKERCFEIDLTREQFTEF